MHMSPVSFLNLPVELICHIFGYLDTHDLIHCSTLTRHLRRIVIESASLQYAIELTKHHMVSLLPSSTPPSIVSRLKLLLEREEAWKTLTWSGHYQLKLPPTGSVYEFIGGLYGNGKEDDHHMTACISFMELPSSDSARLGTGYPDLKMWTHPMLDITIIDFTMDPSQDLLVLIALAPADSKHVYELHLRSLSTNEQHHNAPIPVLSCLPKPSLDHVPDHIAAVRVQVSGQFVALLVKEVYDSIGAHLEIWNWQDNPQYSCKMTRISSIDDFTFLSQDTFLLARPTGRFEVYTFENPTTSTTFPICQACYDFPPLSDGYMYWYITMSNNPSPGYVPKPTAGENATERSTKQIYYPRPHERIHACCLYIFNPSMEDRDHHVHCFVFFININTLLNPPRQWLTPLVPRSRCRSRGSNMPRASLAETDPWDETLRTTLDFVPANYSFTAGPSSPASLSADTPSTSQTPDVIPTKASEVSSSILLSLPPFSPSSNNSSAPRIVPPLAPPLETSPASIPPPVVVPWHVWGSGSTRWFQECLSTDWQHALYGLRTVESVSPSKLKREEAEWGAQPGEVMKEHDLPPTLDVEGGNATVHSTTDKIHPSLQTIDFSVAGVKQSGSVIPETVACPHGHEDKDEYESREEDADPDDPAQRRYLRLRNFSPYSVMHALRQMDSNDPKGKKKVKWRTSRVVTEPSTMNVKGIFKQDVVSSLPYTEVISAETFKVTDVMMDDSRVLLLRRGRNGKLKGVDVLTM